MDDQIIKNLAEELDRYAGKPENMRKLVKHVENNPETIEPIQQLLDRVNAQDIREDVFLQAVALELQTQRERLRHRAAMMRQRAEEFDQYADDLGHREEAIKEYVFILLNHMKEVNHVLDAHAHVEPTKVTNGQ